MPPSSLTQAQRLARDGHPGVTPVLFYRPQDAYGCFSNFSQHYVVMPHPWIDGRSIKYATGEHAFQAAKATNREDHDHVASAKTAYVAKERGGPRGIVLRDGWDAGLSFEVMKRVVLAKAMCHVNIYLDLRGTGSLPIYEDSPTDEIWGWRFRYNYTGLNLLGRAWMAARAVLYGGAWQDLGPYLENGWTTFTEDEGTP